MPMTVTDGGEPLALDIPAASGFRVGSTYPEYGQGPYRSLELPCHGLPAGSARWDWPGRNRVRSAGSASGGRRGVRSAAARRARRPRRDDYGGGTLSEEAKERLAEAVGRGDDLDALHALRWSLMWSAQAIGRLSREQSATAPVEAVFLPR